MIGRLLLCAGLLGGAAGCRAEVPSQAPEGTTPVAAAERTAIVPVEGMSCASCAAKITLALESTPGVVHAEVSLESSEAFVRYREGEVTPERIAASIVQAGFKAGEPRSVAP